MPVGRLQLRRRLIRISLLALLTLDWAGPVVADAGPSFCGRTLEGWIDVLRHGSIPEREDAAWALSYYGAEAARAVPELTAMVADDRSEAGVIVALGRIGPEAAPAVPFLLRRFQKQGCTHMTGTGTFLVDARVRDALVRIGEPSVPGLLDMLNGPDPDMRVCAAEALGGIGPAARDAVPALVRALRANDTLQDDKARILRDLAVAALGKIGAAARPAVPALNALLDDALAHRDEFGSDEWPIVEALAGLGEPPIAKLIEAFARDGDSLSLARLGALAKPAAPALRKGLADRRPEVRIDAALALDAIDPPAPDAVAVLVDGLKHHLEECHFAYEPLGRLGPAASAALPTLIGLVEKGEIEFDCLRALVRIDPQGRVCVPALISALKNPDSSIVQEACESLAVLGPRAARAVPALVEAVFRTPDPRAGLEDDPNVSAVKALARIGPAARVAIPRLIEALKIERNPEDEEPRGDRFTVAEAAARALGTFGPEARDAVPALIQVLQRHARDDENWQLRREAAIALGRIGPDARAAIPVLRRILEEHPPRRSPRLGIPLHPQAEDGAAVALALLAPEGRAGAEQWAARLDSPERRAFVLGAIGEPSLEGELVSRRWLEGLNRVLAQGEREGDELLYVEGYFDRLASLGTGAGSAIPRLEELGRHANPWIRLWAGEARARFVPAR